jgi:hypothetical protein
MNSFAAARTEQHRFSSQRGEVMPEGLGRQHESVKGYAYCVRTNLYNHANY